MTGYPARLLITALLVLTAATSGLQSIVGGESALAAPDASGTRDLAAKCAERDPDWIGLTVEVYPKKQPNVVGQVFSASDDTLAVLTIVNDIDDNGDTQGFDYSASLSVSAVIIQASGGNKTVENDPPARTGAGFAADDKSAILTVTYCYRVRVPSPTASATATSGGPASPIATKPTEPGGKTVTATASPENTSTSTAVPPTSTPEITVEPSATSTSAPTETAEPSSTATTKPSATAEPSATATSAPTETVEPFATATNSPTETVQASPTSAPTETPTALPTETPTALPTETPTALPTETETAVPTEEATPVPTPETLYGVPDTEGFGAWTIPSGWMVTEGVLRSDGTDFQGYAQPSQTVDRTDYAVEIEMRVAEQPARCGGNVGLVMRGSELGFYAGGIEWVCDVGPQVRLWAYSTILNEQPIEITGDWMTLRIEAIGDTVRLSINGVQISEVTDSTFPQGGQIALWSNRVQVEVRAVRVIATA